MRYRLVRRGMHLWWQPLEPRVYTLRESAEFLWGWVTV